MSAPTVERICRRWTARSVPHCNWSSTYVDAELQLNRRGFAVTVWRKAQGVFATVGERHHASLVPEVAEDGTPFAAIWLHAATDGELQTFVRGIELGEILMRDPRRKAS